MSNFLTRRNFFKTGGGLLASSAFLSEVVPSLEADQKRDGTPLGEDYYEKLGVKPFINAAGTYTYLTASIMPPEVREAVNRATLSPVDLHDLQQAAGEYLAKRLHCEAAMVTDGAASALTLATAACITLGRKQAVLNVPNDITDLPNEILIQKDHRYEYDHAARNCGVKMLEVVTLDEYDRAFNPRTAMAHFFNAAPSGQISREDWIRVAHQHGVPASNDAAADVPPTSHLWDYTQMGFDLVQISGGKGLRGPQNSGLLLGKKELIEAAGANNNPVSDSIGRGMKVSKEQIIGLVAAVDWFLGETDEARDQQYRRQIDRIVDAVKNIPSVQTQVFVPPVANHVPHLLITYDLRRIKKNAQEIQADLLATSPRIQLNPTTGGDHSMAPGLPTGPNVIVIAVWMLLPGEAEIVAKRLHEVLSRSAAAA
jgi:L-seryl-tRNA(Ser) seleniumtransferase